MHRKAIIECKKIIETINKSNFEEKTKLLMETIKVPFLQGLLSAIEESKYLIKGGRNKLSDKELRHLLRRELLDDLHQLKKYGPISISPIVLKGEKMKLYRYYDFIGTMFEVELQVEYHENNYWNGEPVQVYADRVRVIDTRGLDSSIPFLYKNTQNDNIINKDYIIKKMAESKKEEILLLYNNQGRKASPDRILDLCLEAAKELGYKEVYVKTLDLYTYLWRCERVI